MRALAKLVPLMLAAASAAAQAADVNVLTAWYGQSCGAAHGNVTAHVKSRCDGRPTCQYGVDAGVLGDPAPGCPKNMVVVFACTNQPSVRLSQIVGEANGKTLVLSCVAGQAQQ